MSDPIAGQAAPSSTDPLDERASRVAGAGAPEVLDLRDDARADVEARAERPLGELMADLGSDVGELVSAQVRLAATEIREDIRAVAHLGQLFGVAALMGFFAALLLSFAAAWGLAEVMAPGLAFLIVGVVWAVGAVTLFVMARSAQQHADPVPHETVDTIKEDVQWFRRQMS